PRELLSVTLDPPARANEVERPEGEYGVWNGLLGAGRVTFSPDGRWIALLAAGRPVRVWNMTTGQELALEHPQEKPKWSLQVLFSPDGSRLVSQCGSSIVVWDLASGKQLPEWKAPRRGYTEDRQGDGPNFAFVFSPDGKHLVWVDSGHRDDQDE